MGNLGAYQAITTASKAVGGPERLVALIATGGYLAGRGIEAGCKKVVPFVKRKLGFEFDQASETYSVINEVTDEQGLTLHVDDEIRVLESDEDAVLIEIVDDNNSPYFVSLDTLRSAIGNEMEIKI